MPGCQPWPACAPPARNGQNQMFMIAPKMSPNAKPHPESITASQRRCPGNSGSHPDSMPTQPVENIW